MSEFYDRTFVSDVLCPVELRDAINLDAAIVPVCENLRVENGKEVTFSFVSALSGVEEVALDTLIAGFVCPTEGSTVGPDFTEAAGVIYTLVFAKDKSKVKNSWISHEGNSSDKVPGIIPWDSKLVGLTFSNYKDSVDTDIMLYLADVDAGTVSTLLHTWQIRNTRVAHKTSFDPELLCYAGDKIAVYAQDQGKEPKDVTITLYFQIITPAREDRSENFTGGF